MLRPSGSLLRLGGARERNGNRQSVINLQTSVRETAAAIRTIAVQTVMATLEIAGADHNRRAMIDYRRKTEGIEVARPASVSRVACFFDQQGVRHKSVARTPERRAEFRLCQSHPAPGGRLVDPVTAPLKTGRKSLISLRRPPRLHTLGWPRRGRGGRD